MSKRLMLCRACCLCARSLHLSFSLSLLLSLPRPSLSLPLLAVLGPSFLRRVARAERTASERQTAPQSLQLHGNGYVCHLSVCVCVVCVCFCCVPSCDQIER